VSLLHPSTETAANDLNYQLRPAENSMSLLYPSTETAFHQLLSIHQQLINRSIYLIITYRALLQFVVSRVTFTPYLYLEVRFQLGQHLPRGFP
jgi:hypothetical protein